jgi:leucyl/phenylalanyl-tRNA--protein transferase
MKKIQPETILQAYKAGIFPMADNREAHDIFWLRPQIRGIFPMDYFHIPKSFKKTIMRSDNYITINHDFEKVIHGCIHTKTHNRTSTWINPSIEDVFIKLHHLGYAHAFETRNASGELTGGLYGLSINGAFFGESMFSLEPNASKFSLVAAHYYLKQRNFLLFDTQFTNSHIMLFGCLEMRQVDYEILLKQAISCEAQFNQNIPQKIDLKQALTL